MVATVGFIAIYLAAIALNYLNDFAASKGLLPLYILYAIGVWSMLFS